MKRLGILPAQEGLAEYPPVKVVNPEIVIYMSETSNFYKAICCRCGRDVTPDTTMNIKNLSCPVDDAPA